MLSSTASTTNDDRKGTSTLGFQSESLFSQRRSCGQCCRAFLSNPDNIIVSSTVIAVFFSIGLGVALKFTVDVSPRQVYLISFPGVLLMNMLKMLIIPLIVSSLVTGLSGLDAKSSGKIGSYSMIYYVLTTALAVILGIILVLSIHPGDPSIKNTVVETKISKTVPSKIDSLLDLFRNMFPENIVQACTAQQHSFNVKRNVTNPKKSSPGELDYKTIEITIAEYVSGTNVLGLVTFSVAIGLILGQMGEEALVMVQFFYILNEIVMRLVKVIMWYSPIGIFFLILGKMLEINDLEQTAKTLGLYMVTVISGLAIHALGTLSLMYVIICRRNPFRFFKGIFPAWITALGTASSAATLPITFRCLEENLGIDKRVTRFVLPIGATINMDGTALYEAVASIFIAQINGKDLTVSEVIIVSVTATLAAIGAASVPSAGLVTMMLVLTSVGLPTDDISLILAVDWFLDRIRTSVNVVGDAIGAAIVHRLCKADLAAKDAEEREELDAAIAEAANQTRMHAIPEEDTTGPGSGPPSTTGPPRKASLHRPKKRLSVAAAMRLQNQISTASVAAAASLSIDETEEVGPSIDERPRN